MIEMIIFVSGISFEKSLPTAVRQSFERIKQKFEEMLMTKFTHEAKVDFRFFSSQSLDEKPDLLIELKSSNRIHATAFGDPEFQKVFLESIRWNIDPKKIKFMIGTAMLPSAL